MITAKLEGGERLAAGLRAAQTGLAGQVRQTLEGGLLLVEADARRNVKQDTRRLSGSITSRIHGQGASLEGEVGPSVNYGFYVEVGRRPGRMPPIAAIAGWARRHGANPFVVARAIGRRGIPPAPFMAPALERNRGRIEQMFARLGIQVVSRIVRGGR